jgi:hypothetical protein
MPILADDPGHLAKPVSFGDRAEVVDNVGAMGEVVYYKLQWSWACPVGVMTAFPDDQLMPPSSH